MPAYETIRVVLVQPEQPRNVGAVMRVAANFGLRAVYVVRDAAFSVDELREVRIASAGAADLVELKTFATVKQTLLGTRKVIGTSGRRRNTTLPVSHDVRNFLPQREPATQMGVITRSSCAVLFGRESQGLNTEELSLCHGILSLPVSASFPSMNLSHAVAVVLCQALWCKGESEEEAPGTDPAGDDYAPRELQEKWLQQISTTAGATPQVDMQQLRYLLHRANPTKDEMSLLFNLLKLKRCGSISTAGCRASWYRAEEVDNLIQHRSGEAIDLTGRAKVQVLFCAEEVIGFRNFVYRLFYRIVITVPVQLWRDDHKGSRRHAGKYFSEVYGSLSGIVCEEAEARD